MTQQILVGLGGGSSSTWGSDSGSDFSSDGVYHLEDKSSGQTFYTYAKSLGSKKALLVLACRDQTSGSHFHYSNSWWNSKVKINDTQSAANPITNTSNNFCSEAFFRVPVKGAFITGIRDSTHGTSWIEYTGTYNNMNSLPSGGQAASQATSANLVGMEATDRGGSFVNDTTGNNLRNTLTGLGQLTGNPLGSTGATTGNGPSDGNGSYRPGNGHYLAYNPSDSYAHSSNSKGRARLGKTWAWEYYSGGAYSAGGFGFGVAADDQDGGASSPGLQAGSGYQHARSNAGNSGLNEYDYSVDLELWINPQDSWEYSVL